MPTKGPSLGVHHPPAENGSSALSVSDASVARGLNGTGGNDGGDGVASSGSNPGSTTNDQNAPPSSTSSKSAAKAKKKKQAKKDKANAASSQAVQASNGLPKEVQGQGDTGSGGSLVICRNKHWRYISSYHGPWLNLPPEVLESLAYHNYASPRPRQVDPAIFFDLVKIRRLVDDATNISVRAASGVASSSLSSSYSSSTSSLMGGGNAAILGIGLSNPNSNAKLSRERKHRMRELATQKLAKAYTLDEIAASVATMQAASTLEDVAGLVLSRSPNDADAKYVHFFHEKIPSRMLANCTSLEPLDDVISDRPSEGAPLRTRAVTKGFKEDYVGAAADLTTALRTCRMKRSHEQLGKASDNDSSEAGNGGYGSTWRGSKNEEDQPSSLEMQLLFHRAAAYLTMACQSAETAIGIKPSLTGVGGEKDPDAARREVARKSVRTSAKRALRDYLKFLSNFDYTPGLPWEATEEYLRSGGDGQADKRVQKILDDYNISQSRPWHSQMWGQGGYGGVHVRPGHGGVSGNNNGSNTSLIKRNPQPPKPPVYPLSTLFTSPPSDLPPYPPPTSEALVPYGSPHTASSNHTPHTVAALIVHPHESITYHPLLTDALHSLLLCHSLLATPPKEIQRYAYMVARLARVCDGYPIFLAARSPARADWIEVLKRVGDWCNLGVTWESLCEPAPLPIPPCVGMEAAGLGSGGSSSTSSNPLAALEGPGSRRMLGGSAEDISSALWKSSNGSSSAASLFGNGSASNGSASHQMPRRWAQEDGKEYPISTERASVIARFVKEEIKRDRAAKQARNDTNNNKPSDATVPSEEIAHDQDVPDTGRDGIEHGDK